MSPKWPEMQKTASAVLDYGSYEKDKDSCKSMSRSLRNAFALKSWPESGSWET